MHNFPTPRRRKALRQRWNTAENKRGQKRNLVNSERRAQSEAKDEMDQYRRSRENSDDASPATMENGDRFPKPARRRLMSQLWRIDGQLQHASPFIAAAALGQALTMLASADNSVVR
jgi:hypothetical protein